MVIPCFFEQLGNINVVRGTIALPPARSTKPELISKDNCLWLEKEKLMDFTPAGLRVVPSKLAACPLENDVSPGLWEMKLELERWNDKAQQQEPRQWWSARDLEGCNGIECRHCHATLLVSSEPLQCKDLPSEHWYELVECWICHETKPEEHRARMRPISARSKALLVGSTYFLVHPDDISADTVRLDQDMLNRIDWSKGMATRWVTLLCEKCNKPLGEAQCEQQETKTVMLAIKLFKYSVTLPLSPLERPNFIEFLVHDLVDAAKAHATYRFLIQGKQSNRIYALLWLFNWDTHIIHNHGFKSGDHNGTPEIFRERVMKVLYYHCSGDKKSETHLVAWSKDKSADHLVYPDIYCEQLVESLNETNHLLPPPMRKMSHPAMLMTQNFSVGFIRRP